MIKKFTFLVCAIILIQINSNAQTPISIAQVRVTSTGTSVTIVAVSTSGPELGLNRYVQQGTTGGINVYFKSAQLQANPVNLGDSLQITGTLSSYANNLEIDPTSYTILKHNAVVPPPIVFDVSQIASAFSSQYVGLLVQINGLTSLSSSSTSNVPVYTLGTKTSYYLNGNANYIIYPNVASNNATAGVTNGIYGSAGPTSVYTIVGIMTPFYSSFEMIPRLYSDFIYPPVPPLAFTSGISSSNVTSNSLSINFSTNQNSTSVINYGTTTALGSTVVDLTSTSVHGVNLTGLAPSTVYYLKVTTTNTGGSATSSLATVITGSNSSGSIKAYFVSRVDNSYSTAPANNAVWLNQSFDDTLIAYINKAKYTLDIAIYNWDNSSPGITAAVNNAYNRNVGVRVIVDGSSSNFGITGLASGIHVVSSPQGVSPAGGYYTIMHNKFMVIDALSTNANDPIVWTGSTNWTGEQMNRDRNNLVIFQDQSLAIAYKMEFEQMWGSTSLTPGSGLFGNNKKDITPHYFNIGGRNVQLYFSPSDGTNAQIINAINSANSSLQSANLVITRTDIANAIKAKALALGQSACPYSFAVLDDTSDGASPYHTMLAGLGSGRMRLKIPTSTDTLLHHKYLIVDSEAPSSDPLVLTGSHNWSTAGETYNDENTVIIHDTNLPNQFYQEVAKTYAVFGGGAACKPTGALTALDKQELNNSSFVIYPNPAKSELNIRLANFDGKINVNVTDLSGKSVLTSEVENGTTLNLSNIPLGLYIVKLSTSKQTQFEKLLVE